MESYPGELLSVEELKMASGSAASQPRVTEEERRRAEEDQARLDRICLFLKERRRRRSRVIAVTTVAAGMLLLAALAGWQLGDRGNKPTSAAPESSPAVTQPIESPVPIEKAPAESDDAATSLATAPSPSDERKPAGKPKAVRHARSPVQPPKFLKKAQPPSETPVTRPTDQPAPDTATPITGARPDDGRRDPGSPTRTVAPSPGGSPVDPRPSSDVESP
jgi:hypothetical protein